MKCRKCGSENMGVMPNKKNPSATDLYCLDCGAWQKFATKGEIRLYQCKKKPITNADRIRAMSDEELAVFLDDLTCLCVDCNDHDGVNENCPIYKQGCGRYCEPKDLMDWLQQPAEEDT